MITGMRLVIVALMLQSIGQSFAKTTSALEPVFWNLEAFRFIPYELEPGAITNHGFASWSKASNVAREEQRTRYSTAELQKLSKLRGPLFKVRVLLIPLVLMFVMVQTRSFFQADPRNGWPLLGLVILIWLAFLSPSFSADPASMVAILAGASVAVFVVVTRDELRFGSPRMGLGIMALALSCLLPVEHWLVPKSYAYLGDYEFPAYRVSSISTNTVVVHEKLDLRTGDRKAVLFMDGRRELVPRERLEQLLLEQQAGALTGDQNEPSQGALK